MFLYPNSALFSFSDILLSNLNILAPMLDYMQEIDTSLAPSLNPFLTSFASLHLVTLVWSWRPVTWSLLHIGLTKSGPQWQQRSANFPLRASPSRRNFQQGTEPVELWRGCGAFVLASPGRSESVFPFSRCGADLGWRWRGKLHKTESDPANADFLTKLI